MRVTRTEIHAIAKSIGAEFRPEKVVLFGSHAYGTPSEDSDVDLLVIMEHSGSGGAQALEIVRRVRSRIPVDLVVRTPQEMRQRLKWNDFFLMEVVKRGEVLYESAHPYLKAILQEQSIPFGRTHNLIALLDLLLPHAGAWEDARRLGRRSPAP